MLAASRWQEQGQANATEKRRKHRRFGIHKQLSSRSCGISRPPVRNFPEDALNNLRPQTACRQLVGRIHSSGFETRHPPQTLSSMNEDSYRAWDTWLKVVGMVGIAIGGSFTYWQYFDGVERQERTALIEAQKPFLAQRQELYGEATKAVAMLSTSTDPKQIAEAEAAFWSLYWGPLATVESRRVETIMVQIGQCLQNPDCQQKERQRHSLDLAHAIREESAEAWDVLLPKLGQGQPSRE
jgi:hypothetical protein